jgi:hypothetical protein
MKEFVKNIEAGVMILDINIKTYQGGIPLNCELTVYEKGDYQDDGSGQKGSALVLNGFDEIGMFDSEFNVPQYAFVALITEDD